MIAIQGLLIFCVGISLFYYLFSYYCAAKFFGRREGEDEEREDLPLVSILKPVKGAESGIDQNFRSFCCQNYPEYQMLWGTIEGNDPAVSVIGRIKDQYPCRDIGIYPVGPGVGSNEKVWILRNLFEKAKHDLLVVNDADIRVGPDYLKRILSPLKDPKVGLVTTPYRAIETHGKGLYSMLTALYINADFFPSVMVANQLRSLDFGLGATLAIRREVLTKIGGFEALADLLADDFYLGHKTHQAGYQVQLVPYVVDTVIPQQGFRAFFHQQLRWARTVRSCRPRGYFWSVITHGMTASTLFLLLSRFSRPGWVLFALTLLVRLGTAWGMGWKYLNRHDPKERVACAGEKAPAKGPVISQAKPSHVASYLCLLPVRDWLGTLFWLLSFLGNTVTWRDRRFVLDGEGRIHPL